MYELTDKQRTALEGIREVVGSIGHTEIAPIEFTDTGAVWAWFDHARFVIFRDGTFGSTPYGKQRNRWGLVVSDVKKPKPTFDAAARRWIEDMREAA